MSASNPSAAKGGADQGRNMKDYDAAQAANAGQAAVAASDNATFMRAELTANGQGVNGGSFATIAILALKARAAGKFDWWAGFDIPTAAAGDVAEALVTIQSGTGLLTTTGGTFVGATLGSVPPDAPGGPLISSGAAGTPIVITGGGGVGETILTPTAMTIGTTAVGFSFSRGGILYNFAGAPPGGFKPGTNVILSLKVRIGTNRVCQGITMGLGERAGSPLY